MSLVRTTWSGDGSTRAVAERPAHALGDPHFRKRCIAPTWWLTAAAQRFLGTQRGQKVHVSQAFAQLSLQTELSPQSFVSLLGCWNELLSLCLREPQLAEARSLRLPITSLLRGTAADIQSFLDLLERHWMSPISLAARGSVRGNARSASAPLGCVAVARHARVEEERGQWFLALELHLPLRDLCLGRLALLLPASLAALAEAPPPDLDHAFTSVHLDVVRALCKGRSTRRLASYLRFELNRKAGLWGEEGDWGAHGLAASEAKVAHREVLANTRVLYDHGVFGWDPQAPRERVARMRAPDCAVLHCWKLSREAIAASDLETALSLRLAGRNVDLGEVPVARALEPSPKYVKGFGVQPPPIAVQIPVAVQAQGSPKPDFLKTRLEAHSAPRAIPPAPKLPNGVFPSSRAGAEARAGTDACVGTDALAGTDARAGKRIPEALPAMRGAVAADPADALHRRFSRSPEPAKIPGPANIPEQTQVFEPTKILRSTRIPEPVAPARRPPLSRVAVTALSDAEFSVRVLAFYETLTPVQREAFERERNARTAEQFRRYVAPVLGLS